MKKVKFLFRQVQRMRNIIVILALFVCTSICFGQLGQTITINGDINPGGADIAGNGDTAIDNCGKALVNNDDGHAVLWKNPNDNRLIIINPCAEVGDACGAKMNAISVVKDRAFRSMTNNKVIVEGGKFGCGFFTDCGGIAGAWAEYIDGDDMNVSSNSVIITGGTGIRDVFGGHTKKGTVSSNTVTISSSVEIGQNVYGGYSVLDGTATGNTVNLTSVTVSSDVYGAKIGEIGLVSSNTVIINGGKIEGDVYGGRTSTGTVSSNTVTITSGTVRNVYGGYSVKSGTATGNTVNLTSVTVSSDVYGAKIGEIGLVSSNTVIINGGKIEGDVYGGHTSTGTASSNTVTIISGTVRGNVFGGYVGSNGEAIYNTINITGNAEFSTATILCGGICANTTTNNAFTGNTLNIETKGVVVNGISNFEKYKFHLKDIKTGEVILTATSGGCSWDVVSKDYTTACKVDLSRSNIHLHTQGVINKGEYCTLIKSPQGFEDNVVKTEQFEFENEGLLVKYSWEIKIADNGQDLIVKLTDKKIRDEGVAKSLSEGYGVGIVCTNNGMDFVLSKIEETESLLVERKGEIGAFCGLAANKSKSSYNTGSHIGMTGMSMMGGVGIRVEVGGKELSSKEQSPKEQSSKEQSSELTVGVFGEYGTGNSDIDSGLCPCEKKSEGKSNYVGGGLLGRYNVCEDEFRGTKLYLEAILRAGQVKNSFNIKGAKKEYEYDDESVMYGGCALGVGYKHKASEKIDLDWSLRYMFGYQDGRDVERVDADGNGMKFESVTSKRIRVGVRGKYVELEKVKPYIGMGYEHELSGEVKGAIQNGADRVSGDIPAPSFGGGTGICEVGLSGKIWKLGVDISGQGYAGVRKGFGGMLKLKYAFGKDAHAKSQPKDK